MEYVTPFITAIVVIGGYIAFRRFDPEREVAFWVVLVLVGMTMLFFSCTGRRPDRIIAAAIFVGLWYGSFAIVLTRLPGLGRTHKP